MWRPVFVGLLLASGVAYANGRAPGTSTIHFQKGKETEIAAGMTFGLLVSHDGGQKWFYMCEDAVGYGGMYDPHYVYTKSGAVFATTFNGLKVMRDGCTFGDTPAGANFVSEDALGPDDAVYFASTEPTANGISTSCTTAPRTCNDGTSFPTTTMPGQAMDWWQSMQVAPSNGLRIYLAGYRLPQNQPKQFLLFRSDNGGQSFTPLPVTDFQTMPNSTIDIVGIGKTDPNLVYARVTLEDNSVSDAIYKSTNGGQNWTRIFGKPGALSFVLRANNDIVIGSQNQGSFVSTNGGTSFTPLANAPHINCLVENSAGEVWACTQNFGAMNVPSDGFGIMKSKDLATWTGVLRFQDIELPVSCPAGTPQHDKCDVQNWCGLCAQLGCDPKRDCPGIGGGDDLPGNDNGNMTPSHTGSCSTGGAIGFGTIGVALLFVRRRRRR